MAFADSPSARTVRVCVERSRSETPAELAIPVAFTVSRGRDEPSVRGVVGVDGPRCFEIPPGSVTVELRMPAVDTAASKPCRHTFIEQARSGRPLRFFVGRLKVEEPDNACSWAFGVTAAEEKPMEPAADDTMEKDFVILPAIESYGLALKAARSAAALLRLKVMLRDSRPDGHGGLTFSAATCAANEWDFPCYVTRGRFDDGEYISIDESRAVDSDKPGYVVILASGPKDDPATMATLERARATFPTVEVRTSRIYQGCIH